MKKTTVLILALGLIALTTPAFAGDDGAATFGAKCAMCHGKDGSGDTTVGKKQGLRDLGSAEVQKLTDAELNKMIAEGGTKQVKTHQFKNKGLTDAQINALVTFIRTLKN